MFFANPVAACASAGLRSCPAAGWSGCVAFEVGNVWLYEAGRSRASCRNKRATTSDLRPGPFSMGNADTVSGILGSRLEDTRTRL